MNASTLVSHHRLTNAADLRSCQIHRMNQFHSGMQLCECHRLSLFKVHRSFKFRPTGCDSFRRQNSNARDPLIRVERSASESEIDFDPSNDPSNTKPLVPSTELRKLVKRATFGILLALSGEIIVLSGGLTYTCFVAACAYQVSREFNGLIISMRNEKKTIAPPNSIRELMSVFCLLFPLMNFFYPHGGKSALLLSVAVFILLCMEVLFVKKPKFSQLAAAVFGLFYCGAAQF